jgi:tetratricopeptide (TPR) repeat protein
VVNWPRDVEDGVAEERVRMAERLISLDRYGEAEQWADRAEKVHAVPGLVHFRVGQRFLARGQAAAAIAHLEKALRFDPGQPEVEFVLGETLLEAQRPAEAIAHLRRAFEARFRVDLAGYDLVRALGAVGQREEAVRVLRTLAPAQDKDADS